MVGLSLGGYVAMHLAERSPERVRGLVLAGATAEPDGIRAAPYRALALVMDTFDGHGLDRLNRWFFRTRFGAGDRRSRSSTAGSGRPAVRRRCDRLAGHRFKPSLAAYPGPDAHPQRRRSMSRSGSASAGSRRPPRTPGSSASRGRDPPVQPRSATRRSVVPCVASPRALDSTDVSQGRPPGGRDGPLGYTRTVPPTRHP